MGWGSETCRLAAVACVPVLMGAALMGAACSGPDRAAGDSSVLRSATTLLGTDTGTGAGTGTPAGGDVAFGVDGEAQAVKLLVASLDDVPPDVVRFVNDTSVERIDELARGTCGRLDPSLAIAELGIVTIEGRHELAERERELLDLNEYRVAVGALANVYCPDLVPVEAELLGLDTNDDALG